MKKKIALFALLVVAAGFVIAVTPAIQTTTQNFESYSTKAFTTKTTKPLTETTQNTETLKSMIQPAVDSCATAQTCTLGEDCDNIKLCRRFDSDYEIVTGSVEVLRFGHYYKWVLEDHELFDPWMTISCYVDGEWKRRDTRTEDDSFPCTGGGQSLSLEYDEFLRGNRAQCHGSCSDHDDEVDNSKMMGHIYQIGRLPSPKPKTTTNPLDDFVKRFLAWLS